MRITGISAETFKDVVAKVNREYEDNIRIENLKPLSDNRFTTKLGTFDSKATGSRRSASGRRGRYLCWHGFRDVVSAVMDVNPEARVYTGMASYKGKDDFENAYPHTMHTNIGSLMQPAYMPEMCDC